MKNFEVFESLADFSRALNTREVNETYGKYEDDKLPSRRPDVGGKWYGTPDYQTADSLLLGGDKKSAAKIHKALSQCRIKADKAQTPTNALYCSQQGFTPNMGRVLAGHPQNMFNVRREMRDSSKVVTLVFNCGTSGDVTAAKKIDMGVKVLTTIYQLERAGYRCNLYVGTVNCGNDTNYTTFVKVKDAGKALDVTRLAYTFVNPSFHRRHMFAWRERYQGYNDTQMGFSALGREAKAELSKNRKFAGAIYIDYENYKRDIKQLAECRV